nr:hypothetical protein [Bradyrhizobium sp. Ec3.3]
MVSDCGTNHAGTNVRGVAEEGTTTTPFDMVVLDELDRFRLAIKAIERVPGLAVQRPSRSVPSPSAPLISVRRGSVP